MIRLFLRLQLHLEEIDVSKLVLSVLLATLVLAMGASISANEIILKKEILQGWKYSVDSGDTYQDVGARGNSLRQLMKGNTRALFEMEKYAGNKAKATATGYIGGASIAMMLILSIFKSWQDDYQWFLMSAVGFGFVSTLYATSATNHLKEAVRVYNRDEKRLSIEICLGPQLVPRTVGLGSALRISF